MEWNQLLEKTASISSRIILFGPVGTGKSTAACRLGNSYPITLHEDMSAQELIGHFIPKDGTFVWHDGPALRAMREGATLVLNEINKASGAVLTACFALCDDPEVISLTLPTTEIVKPSNGYKVIATMNGEIDEIPTPLLDRFSIRIRADMPSKGIIDKLEPWLRQPVINGYENLRRGGSITAGFISVREAFAFQSLVKSGLSREDSGFAIWGFRSGEILKALQIMNPATATNA